MGWFTDNNEFPKGFKDNTYFFTGVVLAAIAIDYLKTDKKSSHVKNLCKEKTEDISLHK